MAQASTSSPTSATSTQEEIPLERVDTTVGSSVGSFIDLKKAGENRDIDGDALESSSLEGLLAEEDEQGDGASVQPAAKSRVIAMIWMIVNTLATIGIVFTNKSIFSDPALTHLQLSFAAFHFGLTYLTLHVLSRPRISLFTPRRIAIRELLPLVIAWALNVILPNLSLAYSTVTFYQIARILLTPVVAGMNYVLYNATLPRPAIYTLIPACLGVAMVSYYDTQPATAAAAGDAVKTTSPIGVVFAGAGIFASSLYTVWVSTYRKRLNVGAMQLLYNQASVGAFMLLYVIPFGDTFPVWSEIPGGGWAMIFMSGFCAILINISQFFIITQAGPVPSTVVGHVKTCCIVLLGWLHSGRAVGDKSVLGVLIAVGGIISYSVVMMKHNSRPKA